MLTDYVTALPAPIRRLAAVVLVLMVGVSVTEGVGLLLLAPMLRLVGLDLAHGALDGLWRTVSAAFARAHVVPTLATVLAVYVAVVAGRALLQYLELVATAELAQRFTLHLRTRLYRAVTRSEWSYFARQRGGDIAHALTTQLERVSGATTYLARTVAQALVATIYLALALRISPVMTVLAGGSGAVLVLLLRRYDRSAQALGEVLTDHGRELSRAVEEHIAGVKVAKSYRAEERNLALFSRLSRSVARAHVASERGYAAVAAAFGVGSVLILSGMVYVALARLHLTTAVILLMLFLFARMVPQFSTIQQNYHYFLHGAPAFSDVARLTRDFEAHAEGPTAGVAPPAFERALRLSGVSFAYDAAPARTTLADVDLDVAARETTAIVGPSGAGKSTLADVVMGLLRPTAGEIAVDGARVDLADAPGWRDRIGYVSQDSFLFHDTVRNNLLWAAPGASTEDLETALRLSAADEFVTRLPSGMETVIGDRGVRLSGGERQRLALARALLRRPAVLILDEATSALDSENERRIQHALARLHGRLTIVVITHRLSTIRGADVIHVLDRGRVIESGTWHDLIGSERGRLRSLWEAQRIDADTRATQAEVPV